MKISIFSRVVPIIVNCLLLILPVVFSYSCKEQTEAPFLTVETTHVDFSTVPGSKTVPCSSNADITAVSSEPAWCTVIVRQSVNASGIEISVTRNSSVGDARTAIVIVSAGKAAPVEIEVSQASSAPVLYIDIIDVVQLPQQANQQRFTVSANVPFTATSSEKSWCTVEVEPQATFNNLTVTVTENAAMSNRTAEIVISASGFDDLKINILQKRNIVDLAGMNIKGLVSCNGEGIAGVVVSDGYELTVTDSEGVYYLPSEKKTGYVFISTPGNYEAPVTDNIPQFFNRLNADAGQIERMDFNLTAVNNEQHTVVAVADWHLANNASEMAQFYVCLADINSVINKYRSAGMKTYVLALGDMTSDYNWYSDGFALPQYADLVKMVNAPVFNLMGNHDNDPYSADDWLAAQPFRSIIGPTWYSFNLGKMHYAVLDNIVYINNGASQGTIGDMSTSSRITAEQIEWLKKDLAYIADKSAPLIIAMHIPLFNLSNVQELLDCLTDFSNVQILTGHTHTNFKTIPDARRMLMEQNIAAICATWWSTGKSAAGNHICSDGSVGGYGVFEMNGKDVEWYYKSVGYDRDYQFRTFDRNTIHITAEKYAPEANAYYTAKAPERASIWGSQHSGNEVYINVWNYDPNWKIEVTENGVSLPVTQFTAYDPLNLISDCFQRLNRNLEPVSYYPTSHFFKLTAGSPTSTLNIKVTDRFGNVYTETMTRPKELTYDMR